MLLVSRFCRCCSNVRPLAEKIPDICISTYTTHYSSHSTS
jgi:hypothetical protein